ncbi:MAG: N-acetyltransferase [Cytophagales bacterium]|nr:MAG: N-acetyltransferase [Cytophagales bacterium]
MNLQPLNLENTLIKLNPLTENDFEKLYKVASDPLIWEQHPISDRFKKEVFQLYFNSALASKSAFLIFNTTENELMGSTRFYDFNSENKSIAIGYTFLAIKYWGGKYNFEVKKMLLDYAFEFVNTVFFHIGPQNIRSQKAIIKIGASFSKEIEYDYYGKKTSNFEYKLDKETWINMNYK